MDYYKMYYKYHVYHVNHVSCSASSGVVVFSVLCALCCCVAIFRFRFISFWTWILGIIRQSLGYNLYAKHSSLFGCDMETGDSANAIHLAQMWIPNLYVFIKNQS